MENRLHSLINAAEQKNPSAFKAAFNAEVMTRIAERIETMKPAVIGSVLGLNTGE